MDTRFLIGDCRNTLKTLETGSVNTCVTSPPYFGLRDYNMPGQCGLEGTPNAFRKNLVDVFHEVKRVLKDDGTLWLNLGDSFGKNKNLLGIPWSVAFALQADGWILRSDIIWAKTNPMPESVTDRPTRSHEYIFLLTKSTRYYYDHKAVREPVAESQRGRVRTNDPVGGKSHVERGQHSKGGGYTTGKPRKASDSFKRVGSKREQAIPGQSVGTHRPDRAESTYDLETRNKRDVWTVSTKPFRGSHFATFPPDLIEPCIKAGCPEGGVVLDPFGGAGTTGLVANRLGRKAILCELNPEYVKLSQERLRLGKQK